MKKLPYIFLLSNVFLLGSEDVREYTKNTCNRAWDRDGLTDEEYRRLPECSFSRFEVYDKFAEKHIAHIAYEPSECHMWYLRVDKEYKRQGIGTELAKRAIEDMRANYNCGKISLTTTREGEKFWQKLGAKPRIHGSLTYILPDPSSEI